MEHVFCTGVDLWGKNANTVKKYVLDASNGASLKSRRQLNMHILPQCRVDT